MAKQTCAICGAEINVFQSQKLTDGSYICRKTCKKKGFKDYDYTHASLPAVKAHLEQVELGTKLWQTYFIPRLKTKDKSQKLEAFYPVYVAPDVGLMAYVETRYKIFIFGKSQIACVYRIADLVGYDYEEETRQNQDGKTDTRYSEVAVVEKDSHRFVIGIMVNGEQGMYPDQAVMNAVDAAMEGIAGN